MFYRLQLGLNMKEKLKNTNLKKVSVLLEMKCNLVHSKDKIVIIIMYTPHSLTFVLV